MIKQNNTELEPNQVVALLSFGKKRLGLSCLVSENKAGIYEWKLQECRFQFSVRGDSVTIRIIHIEVEETFELNDYNSHVLLILPGDKDAKAQRG